MKDSKAFWDKAAAKYVRSPIKDRETYEKKLSITREYFHPGSRVLEFGCGSGATSILHAPFVASILATDISTNMIELATEKAREAGVNNVQFVEGTLDNRDLAPASFDVVLGLNVLHLLEDVDAAIHRVYQLLKDDGVFISSTSLMGNVNIFLRGVIKAMQLVGQAPYVASLTRDQLIRQFSEGGFSIERECAFTGESLFVVARKHAPKQQG